LIDRMLALPPPEPDREFAPPGVVEAALLYVVSAKGLLVDDPETLSPSLGVDDLSLLRSWLRTVGESSGLRVLDAVPPDDVRQLVGAIRAGIANAATVTSLASWLQAACLNRANHRDYNTCHPRSEAGRLFREQ
jgi:hypothetical protein